MTASVNSRLAVILALQVAAGCSRPSPQGGAPAQGPAAPAPSEYLLSAEPPGARDVADVRKSARADEAVVVVGRVGGEVKDFDPLAYMDRNPWVEGKAAFLIADTSLVPCNARAGDNCPTPWDYCCDNDVLKDSRLMVKLVDRDGQSLPADARTLLGLKELQTVVVRGRAERDESGNVTILASGLFVRP